MALQPQGEGLHPLEEQKSIEGGNGGPGVPQEDGPDIGDKGGGANGVREADPVVAGVRVGNGSVFAGGFPVKFAAVHNDAAQSGAVSADKLGGGVDHDIRPVFDGPDEVGRAEGVVDDQGQAVGVGDGRHGVDVGDIGVGVA